MTIKINRTLVIIDACDHCGKTKLANHLIEKYRFNYYHCGVQPDIREYHNHVLTTIFNDIEKFNSNWVIDRLHISEQVYGTIFRNGPQYDWKKLNQKIINNAKVLGINYDLIMCIPPKNIVIEGHAERLANGNEMFNTVDSVYDAYLKIYEENKLTNIFNIYKYDYTEDSNYIKLDEYLENK